MEEAGYDAKMHSAGERIKVASLEKAMAIYARAIVELGKNL